MALARIGAGKGDVLAHLGFGQGLIGQQQKGVQPCRVSSVTLSLSDKQLRQNVIGVRARMHPPFGSAPKKL